MLLAFLGLALLGSRDLNWSIRIVALQGIVLGVAVLVGHRAELTPWVLVFAGSNMLLKGIVFPLLIFRSLRQAKVRVEESPYIGLTLSLALGAVSIAVAFALANLLTLPTPSESKLIVPVSLANLFMGLILLVSRKQAVTQVVGYLVLENGIFTFSLALASQLPTLVETGVLLDIFVAVFVMGIIIFQINGEFGDIDTSRLTQLHDTDRSRTPRGPANKRPNQ